MLIANSLSFLAVAVSGQSCSVPAEVSEKAVRKMSYDVGNMLLQIDKSRGKSVRRIGWTAGVGGELTVQVKHASLDHEHGGSITFEITRHANLCCSAWDWIGIYQGPDDRLSFKHSQDQTNPTFTATLPIPAGTGNYRFQYSTSLDQWKMHDLAFSIAVAQAESAGLTGSVQARVADLSFGSNDEGSIKIGVVRGGDLCCDAWDWIGIYKDGPRISFTHSQDAQNPDFIGALHVPSKGSFTFGYSSPLGANPWKVFSLGLTFAFATVTTTSTTTTVGIAPPVHMECLIPSYWWPTDSKWDTLVNATQVSGYNPHKVQVVLNVNNGYCLQTQKSVWQLWKDRAKAMSEAGFKVFAYVNICSHVVDFTCVSQAHQGNRTFNEVKLEIDKLHEKLGAWTSGFFLDDAGHSGRTTQPVLRVTDYVKSLGGEVIHNPGVYSNDEVLLKAATVTIMREGHDPGPANPFTMFPDVPARKSSMILHQVASDAWEGYLQKARDTGYGHFYATSGGWDSLPPYLVKMFTALEN